MSERFHYNKKGRPADYDQYGFTTKHRQFFPYFALPSAVIAEATGHTQHHVQDTFREIRELTNSLENTSAMLFLLEHNLVTLDSLARHYALHSGATAELEHKRQLACAKRGAGMQAAAAKKDAGFAKDGIV